MTRQIQQRRGGVTALRDEPLCGLQTWQTPASGDGGRPYLHHAGQQEVAVRSEEMTNEAAKCRAQARHFAPTERELLLKIAEAFEEMASRSAERDAVAAVRCW